MFALCMYLSRRYLQCANVSNIAYNIIPVSTNASTQSAGTGAGGSNKRIAQIFCTSHIIVRIRGGGVKSVPASLRPPPPVLAGVYSSIVSTNNTDFLLSPPPLQQTAVQLKRTDRRVSTPTCTDHQNLRIYEYAYSYNNPCVKRRRYDQQNVEEVVPQ